MIVTIFARYVLWHYMQAPVLLLGVIQNLVWYIGHVFSVNTLGRSLFAPWKRVVAKRTKRWDFEDIASAALANFISRIIGTIMRLFLILTGRSLQLCAVGFGFAFYISWFFLPLLIVLTCLYGWMLFV